LVQEANVIRVYFSDVGPVGSPFGKGENEVLECLSYLRLRIVRGHAISRLAGMSCHMVSRTFRAAGMRVSR